MAREKRKNSSSGKAGKTVAAIFLAAVIFVGCGAVGYAGGNGWSFKKAADVPQESAEEVAEVKVPAAINMQLYSDEPVTVEETITAGITKTVNVSTVPDGAIMPILEYELSWSEPEYIEDYFTIEKDSENEQIAYLTCLQPFRNKTATLTVTSEEGLTASATISYRGAPTEISCNSASGKYAINYGDEAIYNVVLTNEFDDVGDEFYNDITISCTFTNGNVGVLSCSETQSLNTNQYVRFYNNDWQEMRYASGYEPLSEYRVDLLKNMPLTMLKYKFRHTTGTTLVIDPFDPLSQVTYNATTRQISIKPDFDHAFYKSFGTKGNYQLCSGLFVAIKNPIQYNIDITCGEVSKRTGCVLFAPGTISA